MPKLNWLEHEVVECLGVVPETEEFFASHTFARTFGQIRMVMTIWQYESLVALDLFEVAVGSAFLTLQFIVRDRIEFVSEREYSAIRFHDTVVVPDRFWMEQNEDQRNWFDREILPTFLSFELAAFPKFEFKVL